MITHIHIHRGHRTVDSKVKDSSLDRARAAAEAAAEELELLESGLKRGTVSEAQVAAARRKAQAAEQRFDAEARKAGL